MESPKIAATLPTVGELEPGTYYWCACGLSSNQPYCDGSHQGTSFQPVPFEVETKKKMALCNCKHTANAPFCDGAHKKL